MLYKVKSNNKGLMFIFGVYLYEEKYHRHATEHGKYIKWEWMKKSLKNLGTKFEYSTWVICVILSLVW